MRRAHRKIAEPGVPGQQHRIRQGWQGGCHALPDGHAADQIAQQQGAGKGQAAHKQGQRRRGHQSLRLMPPGARGKERPDRQCRCAHHQPDQPGQAKPPARHPAWPADRMLGQDHARREAEEQKGHAYSMDPDKPRTDRAKARGVLLFGAVRWCWPGSGRTDSGRSPPAAGVQAGADRRTGFRPSGARVRAHRGARHDPCVGPDRGRASPGPR